MLPGPLSLGSVWEGEAGCSPGEEVPGGGGPCILLGDSVSAEADMGAQVEGVGKLAKSDFDIRGPLFSHWAEGSAEGTRKGGSLLLSW